MKVEVQVIQDTRTLQLVKLVSLSSRPCGIIMELLVSLLALTACVLQVSGQAFVAARPWIDSFRPPPVLPPKTLIFPSLGQNPNQRQGGPPRLIPRPIQTRPVTVRPPTEATQPPTTATEVPATTVEEIALCAGQPYVAAEWVS